MKLILLLLISFSAHAGYFTHHVTESISINKTRRPYYSELTGGKSDKAYKKLIFLERVIVPSAMIYDHRAAYFQKRGVPVMKDEFVPMNPKPEFDPNNRRIPENEIADIPWVQYHKELKEIVRNKDQEKLLSRSLEIINEFKTQPQYWCLTRHLVESVYRFAWFFPKRIQEAKEKNIRSPEKLLWDVIDYQLLGFKSFVQVDRYSAPVQKEGIPLLCNELPDLLSDLH